MRGFFAVFALALPLAAQTYQNYYEASASLGVANFGNNPIGFLTAVPGGGPVDRVDFNNGSTLALRGTLNYESWFGHEVGLSYTRHDLSFDVGGPALRQEGIGRSAWQGFYDFLAYVVEDEAAMVRPYGAVGAGLASFRARDRIGLEEEGSTEFAFNYGAGVKVRVGERALVRFDFREYLSPKPLDLARQEGWLRQREISVGFGYRF
jgi:opacity protein-like surface antigen